jgi:hypothetical protein
VRCRRKQEKNEETLRQQVVQALPHTGVAAHGSAGAEMRRQWTKATKRKKKGNEESALAWKATKAEAFCQCRQRRFGRCVKRDRASSRKKALLRCVFFSLLRYQEEDSCGGPLVLFFPPTNVLWCLTGKLPSFSGGALVLFLFSCIVWLRWLTRSFLPCWCWTHQEEFVLDGSDQINKRSDVSQKKMTWIDSQVG